MDDKSTYYPLRPMQRWMIDSHFENAKSTMMNIGALLKLDPSIDIERLANAINKVLNAYDIFHCRLTINPETGDICQRFDGEVSKVIVEHISDEEFAARINKLKDAYYLIDNPLYRIYVIQMPTAKYLYLDFYHAIMDGASIAMLFWRSMDMAYKGKWKGNTGSIDYADYVLEEYNMPPEELAEGREYWIEMLKDFDMKKHLLPFDKSGEGWEKKEMNVAIKNIHRSYFKGKSFSENTFMMAAAMLALAKVIGVKESIIEWIHNGRNTSAERRLMGTMLVSYPVRYNFDQNLNVVDFLLDLEAMINKGMTYRKSLDIVYSMGLEDYTVTFVLQKGQGMNPHGALKLNGTDAVVVEMPENEISAAENSLDIEIIIKEDDTYLLELTYNASCYTEKAMEHFADVVDEMILSLQDEQKFLMDII